MPNSTKRILVIGKSGQLGRSILALVQHYPLNEFTFVDREVLDLSNSESIASYFNAKTFDVIINCAAYTAVDKAESEQKLANQINHLAVKQLAQIVKQQNATLIHVSTDYVFNGQNFKPYIESDQTDPQSTYGLTKLKGEQAIQQIDPKGLIIRTSWVYSEYGNNFVKTMLNLGRDRDSLNIIFDQIGTPTYAGDLAKLILSIVESDKLTLSDSSASTSNKIFHYSNEGVCSWYDFAKVIFEFFSIECQVTPIETKDYPTPANRPHYSLLNKAKIKETFDLTIPYWKDSLKMCVKRLEEQA
jgi:dTDP-4-dehydrorhamnose reductase